MKECPSCKTVKSLTEFEDYELATGFGRVCNECKGYKGRKTATVKKVPKVLKPNKDEARAVLTAKKCPRCESFMVLRTRKVDGHKFYGCSRFPKCIGTRFYKEGS